MKDGYGVVFEPNDVSQITPENFRVFLSGLAEAPSKSAKDINAEVLGQQIKGPFSRNDAQGTTEILRTILSALAADAVAKGKNATSSEGLSKLTPGDINDMLTPFLFATDVGNRTWPQAKMATHRSYGEHVLNGVYGPQVPPGVGIKTERGY